MKERLKEQYEAPATKRTRVEMENGICQASVPVRPDGDVGEDKHVTISPQEGGTAFGENAWKESSF